MSATYKVDGMTCGGCAASVTKAIVRVAPNAKVEVKLEGGKVQVEGEHDEQAVREAVEAAGFDFRGAAA